MIQLNWAYEVLKIAFSQKFTGNIKFNFTEGTITNVNKEESIRPPKN